MKICTWNINGIRALRPSFSHFLSTLDADIFCVQETKVSSVHLIFEIVLYSIISEFGFNLN